MKKETRLIRVSVEVADEVKRQMHRLCLDTRMSTVAVAVELLKTKGEAKKNG